MQESGKRGEVYDFTFFAFQSMRQLREYKKLRNELLAIYYADYFIDEMEHRLIRRAIGTCFYETDSAITRVMREVVKKCKFEIFYANNSKLLYEHKYKDLVIKHIIQSEEVPKEHYTTIYKKLGEFKDYWFKNRVGINETKVESL